MMRPLAIAVSAVALLGAASAADAQSWASINQRQRLLDDRIDAGVRNGQLTRAEASGARAEFRDIAALEARYRRGGLSSWERADLDKRFDRLSDRIRADRHDRQVASGWFGGRGWTDANGRWMTVNQRQKELDRRIDRGVREGRLTRAEARRLRQDFRAIARLEARYRSNGLSQSETADLDRRFDGLAARVWWENHDAQLGYGYGRRR